MLLSFGIVLSNIPIIISYLFLKKVSEFKSILYKNNYKLEEFISFKKPKDFLHKNIRQKLESYNNIEKSFVNEIMRLYNNLLFYILIWMLYILSIIVIIKILFFSDFQFSDNKQLFILVLVEFWILYEFLLTPIFKFLGLKKLYQFGYSMFEIFSFIMERFIVKFKRLFIWIIDFVLGGFLFWIYIKISSIILTYANIEINFFMLLIITILFYNYVVLKIFSYIIKNVMIFLFNKCDKLKIFEKHCKDDNIHLILKNATYLFMVVLYANSIYTNNSDNIVFLAIATSFLFDTFIDKAKEIEEKTI